MMRRRKKLGRSRSGSFLQPGIAIVFLALAIAGCATVGPVYTPPEVQVPSRWNGELRKGVTEEPADPAVLARWWTTFDDPALDRLMEQAVDGSLTLKEAHARVKEARARRRIGKAGLYPTVEVSGSITRQKGSRDTGGGLITDLYNAGFDANWELDFFGRVRRSVEAADADLQAREESLRDAMVSLLAEVASEYIQMRTYQERLATAQKNLKALEETYELVRFRSEAGLVDELDLQQASYNMESSRSQIPALRSGVDSTLNSLAILLGRNPGSVHDVPRDRGPIPVAPPSIAVGVPADALRQRPDVRRAERDLAAQAARVGVATADFYPKFSLLGSIGLESLSGGSLFSSGARTYSVGPTVSWPIFDAGAIRGNIEVQSALQEQALIAYQSAVLGALKDVQNALVAYSEERHRRDALLQSAKAAEQALSLAQDKYKAGLVGFLTVLDAQRSLFSIQDQLAASEGTVTTNVVRLYKALGGGWTPLASESGSPTKTGR
ncbi:MAG: efflux transporter outer membrane subunit [Deltaproteobacteria bacterium]|nr:efflux transporter outer membrane subunit [Deltaproteobacteria bacterium]